MNNVDKTHVRKDRDKYIGGSDMSSICEILSNQYECKYHLHWHKQFGEEDDSLDDNVYIKFGNTFEDEVLQIVNNYLEINAVKTDGNILEVPYMKHYKFRANIDGWDEEESTIVEIKCRRNPTLKVQDILQAHTYALVKGAKKIVFGIGKMEPDFTLGYVEIYQMEVSQDTIKMIEENCEAFDKLYFRGRDNLSLNEMKELKMALTDDIVLGPRKEVTEWIYQNQEVTKEVTNQKICSFTANQVLEKLL